MADYRLYPLDSRRRIFGPAIPVRADDDEDAIAQAADREDIFFGAEVWLADKLIAKIPPETANMTGCVALSRAEIDLALQAAWLRATNALQGQGDR